MNQPVYVPKAQEARNKATVERYFREVLDAQNAERLRELMTADVVLHRPGFDVVGLESAMQRLRGVFRDYAAFASELTGLMAEGDMVSVRIRHRTRVRPHVFRSRAGELPVPAEQPLEWAAIVQFRLKDGKIAEEWVMRDELGMLAQLGRFAGGA